MFFFECTALKISKIVSFVVDSGAVYSAISEKDATIMGLDFYTLPDCKFEAVGFGGTFKNKVLNRKVTLTFGANDKEYKVSCGSFKVVVVPPQLQGEEREKMLRYTPSVLGMDILRKFQTTIMKNRVELVPLKK